MKTLDFKAALSVARSGTVIGTAWLFGSPDRLGDVIEKGAFAGTRAPLPMLFGHDPNDPVGVWESIHEDAQGLQVKGRLLINDVARAREALALVEAGAVTGLSIGFQTRKIMPRRGGGKTISALDLVEISLTPVPMHPGARLRMAKAISPVAARLAIQLNRAAVALERR
jgi:uncharacterized protein